jgi:hypothetical protein
MKKNKKKNELPLKGEKTKRIQKGLDGKPSKVFASPHLQKLFSHYCDKKDIFSSARDDLIIASDEFKKAFHRAKLDKVQLKGLNDEVFSVSLKNTEKIQIEKKEK